MKRLLKLAATGGYVPDLLLPTALSKREARGKKCLNCEAVVLRSPGANSRESQWLQQGAPDCAKPILQRQHGASAAQSWGGPAANQHIPPG